MEEETPAIIDARIFAVIFATLGAIALVPAAFWLADASLLPWADELRWQELRAETNAESLPGSVELTRGGCFGDCPIYSVKLFTDGRVEFEGHEFVCAQGRHSARVSEADARDLMADIADASDSTLALEYGARRRTLPSIDAESNSPRLLRQITRTVDEVANTARWVPRRTGGRRICEGIAD